MAAYLTVNPPARQQFYVTRRARPTGLVVLHTSESVMDTVGPDTGAENVARFIRDRTSPGSYHDLVDSDSVVHLVPYESAAFHDGTGSNNWSLSVSFACRASDWPRMSATRRHDFLHRGAEAFARQQVWLRAHDYPTTPLRLVSKAESDAGKPGLIYHGHRDPSRRTDPGITTFPIHEFIAECRAALAGGDQEDDMPTAAEIAKAVWDHRITYGGADAAARLVLGDVFHHARRAAGLAAQAASVDVDEAALARELAPLLAPAVVEALGQDRGLTQEQVEAAIRRVLGSLDEPSPA
jgi:hypothetical protein